MIEVKYAENGAFDAAYREAKEQIELKQYAARLKQEGMKIIHTFGVACYKKECRVISETIKIP